MNRNTNASKGQSLRFVCEGCGTPLILPSGSPAVGGPCPKCATWIEAASFRMTEAPAKTFNVKIPEAGASLRYRSGSISSAKGRVHPDGHLDYEHIERKELFVMLRIIAVSLAVSAVILFITMYLRQWMQK